MYEYDTQQMMSSEVFTPDTPQPYQFASDTHPDAYFDAHLGSVPDAYLDAVPDTGGDAGSDAATGHWDLDSEFEQLFQPQTRDAPPSAIPRADRRRKRPRLVRPQWASLLGIAIVVTTAAVTGTVSVLSARVSYGPLRALASPTADGLASSWPLLIYGPWSVACLSILHAVAHRRQVRAAWLAVLLFSVIAMALCIAQAPRTVTAIATAGLPPVSALVSFQLLFRQITLLHPRHAKLPRQRKH